MRITEIRPRRKAMMALYIDGEYAVSIDKETLLLSGFKEGREIDDDVLLKLIEASNARRAKEKALWLLSYRDHSKAELIDKIGRTCSKEAASLAADKMEQVGLLNDEEFARRYAAELFSQKHFGKKRTEYELQRKGIDKELIHEIIEEISPDPMEQLKTLLLGKYARSLSDEKGRRRTVAALERLGYRWEDIRRALQEYAPSGEHEDDY